MKSYNKQDFPVSEIRRLLEPGPIVLVSSKHKGRTNMGAGHGGASGRFDRLDEIAIVYAFALWAMGMAEA